MINYWIAIFGSTMSLLQSPTSYVDVREKVNDLMVSQNTWAVVETTASVAIYLNSVGDFQADMTKSVMPLGQEYPHPSPNFTKNRIFRATEQRLITDANGEVIFVGSKPRMPFQWVILSVDVDADSPGSPGSPSPDYIYDVSTSSTTLINYAISYKDFTGLDYKIYKGTEYEAKLIYSYKLIPK
jgi:hypothetical protein